jgi:hypothetical protein
MCPIQDLHRIVLYRGINGAEVFTAFMFIRYTESGGIISLRNIVNLIVLDSYPRR